MSRLDFSECSSKLLRRGEIWMSPENGAVSYPDEGNDLFHQVEESSFWFAHRNSCILECVKKFPPGGFLLDVGGGNGFVTGMLEKKGFQAVLLESGERGIQNAEKRGIVENVIYSTLENAGFYPEVIPSIGIFDVLEHSEDDDSFLEKIHQILIPGGRLYITVPAHRFLWSKEDDFAGHYRRYNLKTLKNRLANIGFQVEFTTYFFSILLIPILLFRALPAKMGFSGGTGNIRRIRSIHARRRGISGRILNYSLNMEMTRIKKGKTIPMGSSCLLAARKMNTRSNHR